MSLSLQYEKYTEALLGEAQIIKAGEGEAEEGLGGKKKRFWERGFL